MPKKTSLLAVVAVLAATACTGNWASNEHDQLIVVLFDQATTWNSRDVSGLSETDPPNIAFDVYLPDGGSWDDKLRARIASGLHAGKVGGNVVAPKVTFAAVPEHPNVLHVNAATANQGPGTHWFALEPAVAQPFHTGAGYTLLTAVPKDIAAMAHAQPGLWLRTVGKCPHAVEVSRVAATNGAGAAWSIQLSEAVGLPSAATNAGDQDITATAELFGPAEAEGPAKILIGTKDSWLSPLNPPTVSLGAKLGLAGSFGASGACNVAPLTLTMPIGLGGPPTYPINYELLARLLAPTVFAADAKPKSN